MPHSKRQSEDYESQSFNSKVCAAATNLFCYFSKNARWKEGLQSRDEHQPLATVRVLGGEWAATMLHTLISGLSVTSPGQGLICLA